MLKFESLVHVSAQAAAAARPGGARSSSGSGEEKPQARISHLTTNNTGKHRDESEKKGEMVVAESEQEPNFGINRYFSCNEHQHNVEYPSH